MQLRHKIGAWIAFAVLLSGPAMACLQPAADLTPDEQECCRHMAHQCGDSGMGESHSCCRTEVRSPGAMLVVAKTPVRVQTASVALLPSFNQAIAHLNADGFSPTPIPSARAGPPIGASAILRI